MRPANDVSLVISSAALALSLASLLIGRWRDKRDLLLRVHDSLITADQQRGRRLIYAMRASKTQAEDLSDDEFGSINNALASLDTLGFYCRRRYIRRKDALELWAYPVVRLLRAAEPFLAYRDEMIGRRIWPDLRAFGTAAEQYLQRTGVDIKAVKTRDTASANPGA